MTTDVTFRDLTFTITGEQRMKIRGWMFAHACVAKPDSFGGLLTYQFTPCGIGDSIKVLCPCGAKLDLTDYSTW